MKIIALCAATLFLSGAALAQPDLKVTPKAVNPANRAAANEAARAAKKALKADFQQRLTKRIEVRLQRLPKTLAALGVTDEKTQEVIAGHFRSVLMARGPLLEAQMQVRRALLVKTTSDTQFKSVLDAQRVARKAYETAFQAALDDLDGKVAFRKTPRLEAVLLAIGALDPDGLNSTL